MIGDPTAMLELFRLFLATLVAGGHSHQRLAVENLLLRQQLQVALRSRRRPRLRARDQLFWLLVRRLHRDWRRHLLLVRPETVLGWHRKGWRLFWRWRSGHALGRPRLNAEVRELIATMAGENPNHIGQFANVETPGFGQCLVPIWPHSFNQTWPPAEGLDSVQLLRLLRTIPTATYLRSS